MTMIGMKDEWYLFERIKMSLYTEPESDNECKGNDHYYRKKVVSNSFCQIFASEAEMTDSLNCLKGLEYRIDSSGDLGCFLCATANELSRSDRLVRKITNSHFENLQAHFTTALQNSKEKAVS